MKKKLVYKEPITQFNDKGEQIDPIYQEFRIPVHSQEELDMNMEIITRPERGIIDIEIVDAEPTIEELKEELSSTDYKITKSAEYQLAGLPAPYDIEELHTARENLRIKINEIEESQKATETTYFE